jgi:hypothetical protein
MRQAIKPGRAANNDVGIFRRESACLAPNACGAGARLGLEQARSLSLPLITSLLSPLCVQLQLGYLLGSTCRAKHTARGATRTPACDPCSSHLAYSMSESNPPGTPRSFKFITDAMRELVYTHPSPAGDSRETEWTPIQPPSTKGIRELEASIGAHLDVTRVLPEQLERDVLHRT